MTNDDSFSVRWMGAVRANVAGLHTFSVTMGQNDERVRLWIDNVLLIDQWLSLASITPSSTITLSSVTAYYDLKVEYQEVSSTQQLTVSWEVGGVAAVIPSTRSAMSCAIGVVCMYVTCGLDAVR